MPLGIVNAHFDCASSQSLGAPGGCFYNDRALVVVSCAFPRTMVTFRRETSCFRASNSTFRELFYVEMQFSWQARHFGHGGDRCSESRLLDMWLVFRFVAGAGAALGEP